MKRFIVLIMVFVFALCAFADTVSVKEGETQLNYRPKAAYNITPTGYIEAGKDYTVVGEVLSWEKVIVEDIKRGKVEGWVGAKLIIEKDGKRIIGGKGCTLRTEPNSRKEGTADGFLWLKSVVTKQTGKVVNFYRIKVGVAAVYVSARYCVLKGAK